MATIGFDGVGLYYEEAGTGEVPVVFVHGSWSSDVEPRGAAARGLVPGRHVRRGHSRSERPGDGSIDDDAPPPAVARALAGALPDAQTVTFPGAGHIPHATHPDEFAEAITSFIGKREG